jgi:hypothetical protein
MCTAEVLGVERVRANHEPRAGEIDGIGPAANQISGDRPRVKGEGEERFGAVENVDISVPLLNREAPLLGEIRYLGTRGNTGATPIGAVFPVMERAANRFAHHPATAEISTQMRTTRVKGGDATSGGAKHNQPSPEEVARDGAAIEFGPAAEEIPGYWIRRKTPV